MAPESTIVSRILSLDNITAFVDLGISPEDCLGEGKEFSLAVVIYSSSSEPFRAPSTFYGFSLRDSPILRCSHEL